jgi:hypothetical protein
MFFSKVLSPFSKMDIYKCPFLVLRLDFCEKFVILQYIFSKWLKETYNILISKWLKEINYVF